MWETIVLPALMGLIGHNLKQLHDSSIDWGEQKWSEIETKFNRNFTNYYRTVYRYYEKVPYLLSADNKVPLLDIYQPSFLIDERKEDDDGLLTDSLDNLLREGDHIWIDGHGGIGKSTMLKYFLLKQLREGRKADDQRIPVYVELRRFNKAIFRKDNFVDFLYVLMQKENFDLELQYFKYMVEQGRFIFLLDAFDEVHSEFQEDLATLLSDFINQYHDNAVIISSRQLINHAINHPNLLRFETQGLNQDQAISLVEKIEIEGTSLSSESKEEFLDKLADEAFYEEYQSFIANPILLFLMLQTYNRNQDFPKEQSQFLLDSFDYLHEKHDKGKLIPLARKLKTGLHSEALLRLVSAFCYELYFFDSEDSYELSRHKLKDVLKQVGEYETVDGFELNDFLHDMTTCLSMLYREGDNYFFVHNVFKEFFAAYYLYQEFPPEELTAFFKKLTLNRSFASYTEKRVVDTTLTYFAELDKINQKDRLDLEVILPLLEVLEARYGLDDVRNVSGNIIFIRFAASVLEIGDAFTAGKELLPTYYLESILRKRHQITLFSTKESIRTLFPFQCVMGDEQYLVKFAIRTENNWIPLAALPDDERQQLRKKLLVTTELAELQQFLAEKHWLMSISLSADDCLNQRELRQFFEELYGDELKALQDLYQKLKAKKEVQERRSASRWKR